MSFQDSVSSASDGGQTPFELMMSTRRNWVIGPRPQFMPGVGGIGSGLLTQFFPTSGSLTGGEPEFHSSLPAGGATRSPRFGATYARTSGAGTGPKSPSLGALSTAASSGSASTSAV